MTLPWRKPAPELPPAATLQSEVLLLFRVLADHEGSIRRLEEQMSEESDARDALGVEVAAVGTRFDATIAKMEAEIVAAGITPSPELADLIAASKADAAALAAMHPDAAPAAGPADVPAPPA
jgi:hypothetical protein